MKKPIVWTIAGVDPAGLSADELIHYSQQIKLDEIGKNICSL